MSELIASQLPAFIEQPVITSMTFLNEVAIRYPDAISFAPGRPHERFFDVASLGRYLDRYTCYLRADLGYDEAQVGRTLLQYGPTAGTIRPLVAQMLATDEAIDVPPEALVMTVGCQEAIFLAVRALCPGPRDVIFLAEPGYLGLAGAALTLGVPTIRVPEGDDGIDLTALGAAVQRARDDGLNPRAVYVIPDFANPTGTVMSGAGREALLELAAGQDLFLLEDNPYGFTAREHVPTLKALDRQRRVIYLGTFAKICLPGTRVGFVIADQQVADAAGRTHLLADDLATIKSMITVNTSPIDQAVIAGMLLENGSSLKAVAQTKAAFYQHNLDVLLRELSSAFPPGSGVRWNSPPGGFFVVVDVPFRADEDVLRACAARYGVLWTPMSFFHEQGGQNRLRLSASYLDPDQIVTGVARLARFVREQRAGTAS
jgi:(S)-3,5-dihydroxyphenylglycine transaminase